MTAASGRGQRPIRIGNCSGFYGDRASAMADMGVGKNLRRAVADPAEAL